MVIVRSELERVGERFVRGARSLGVEWKMAGARRGFFTSSPGRPESSASSALR